MKNSNLNLLYEEIKNLGMELLKHGHDYEIHLFINKHRFEIFSSNEKITELEVKIRASDDFIKIFLSDSIITVTTSIHALEDLLKVVQGLPAMTGLLQCLLRDKLRTVAAYTLEYGGIYFFDVTGDIEDSTFKATTPC